MNEKHVHAEDHLSFCDPEPSTCDQGRLCEGLRIVESSQHTAECGGRLRVSFWRCRDPGPARQGPRDRCFGCRHGPGGEPDRAGLAALRRASDRLLRAARLSPAHPARAPRAICDRLSPRPHSSAAAWRPAAPAARKYARSSSIPRPMVDKVTGSRRSAASRPSVATVTMRWCSASGARSAATA